jgi:tetratricopeptide (TPR) repeat protein
MRAPFADMVLLWYSTIAIPLFGTSDADISISNDDTKFILERNLTKYPQSSLFLYMKGKYHRSILRDLAGSMESYEKAANYSSHIKEIQIISVYEMGWLHMQQLNYTKALEHFEILHKGSKWSKSFGTYICAILHGANGNFSLANQYSKEAIKILTAQTKKTNPIESFALKRNEYIKKNPIKTKAFAEMLVCELLYLWVCYPFMEESYLKKALGSKILV